jgi:hypothetical protein
LSLPAELRSGPGTATAPRSGGTARICARNGAEGRFAQAEADGEAFTPFITKVAGTLFATALTSDIVYLETDEIGPVVEFYHQIKTLNQMADDMRTERYALLPPNRKKALLLDLVRLDHKAAESAEAALAVLEKSLDLAPGQRLATWRVRLTPERIQ